MIEKDFTTDVDNYLESRKNKIFKCGEIYSMLAREYKEIASKYPTPQTNTNMVYFQIINDNLNQGKDILEARVTAMIATGRIK